MFGKVLVCSDGSTGALQATRVAGELATRFHSELTLMSVFDPAEMLASYALPQEAAPAASAVESVGDEMLASIRAKTARVLDKAKVGYRFHRETGHPVERIVEAAQALQADLIVLGSRGLSEWNALLIGSVSDGVLHHAHCPVLIVRGIETTFDKILLACDASAGSFLATRAAGEIARKYKAPLTIINVIAPLISLPETVQGSRDECIIRARDLAATRVQGMAIQANCPYTFQQETGHAAEIVVRSAHTGGYSLIVVGSRGLGALKTLALGSVSNRVAHHAPCSVLVVR